MSLMIIPPSLPGETDDCAKDSNLSLDTGESLFFLLNATLWPPSPLLNRQPLTTLRMLPPSPSPPREDERRLYYFGPNSSPTLVACSSTFNWKEVTGLAGRPLKKDLIPFGAHALNDFWDAVAERIITILDHKDVKWTSIDVVRIGYQNQHAFPI